MKKRLLSLLLTLCMVLSLLPATGVTAGAANELASGVLTIDDAATAATGNGWKWEPGEASAPGTLTLSGVDLTQLVIRVPATIVLEGMNRIRNESTYALAAHYPTGSVCTSLTIKGSGTLEARSSIFTGIFFIRS